MSVFHFGQEQYHLEDPLYSLPEVLQFPVLHSNLLGLTLEEGFTRYACPVPRLCCSPGQEKAG